MVRKQTTSTGVGLVTSNVVDLTSDPTVETLDVSDGTPIMLSMGVDSNLDGTVDGGYIEMDNEKTSIGPFLYLGTLASHPSGPQKGYFYYNSTEDKLYIYKTSWEEVATGGGGETNTAANVGTDGVGVYDAKSGVELQFRNVAPASSKVTVTLNSKDIDIDVSEGNLTHNNLGSIGADDHHNQQHALNSTSDHTGSGVEDNFMGIDANGLPKDSGSKASDFAVAAKGVTNGDSHDHNGGDGAQIDHTTCSNIGTNTHAQIDSTLSTNTSNISTNTSNLSTHTSSTSNPHSVTAAQAGASPTYTDAGDASAWDYDSGASTLTIDGSWHTLDISSKIGSAAAKLVHLRMFISDNAVGYEFFINTGGNSNEHNSAVVKCLVANQNNHADAFVYTNSSGEIRYKATSGTDRIALLIRGYF